MDKKHIPFLQTMKRFLPSSIVDFLVGVFFLMLADKIKSLPQYYWSSSVRSAAAWLTGFGMLLFLFFAIQLGLGLAACFLLKKGRVCAHCGKLTTSSSAVCPFCQGSLSDAIPAQKLAAAPPKPSAPPAASAERTAPPAPGAEGPVCPQCHHPTHQGDTFCAVCGCSLTPPASPNVCPVCQAEANPGDQFCKKCGSALPGGQHADT